VTRRPGEGVGSAPAAPAAANTMAATAAAARTMFLTVFIASTFALPPTHWCGE
jgi:hypothetical protein